MNRAGDDAPVVTAFDFIRDEEGAAKLEKLREAKRFVKAAIGQMPMTTPRSKFLEIRSKSITDLAAMGYRNADQIFDSVWPSLKPTAEEQSK